MLRNRERTIHFTEWLQAVELEDLDVYALYKAVEDFTTEGPFTCSPGADVESTVRVVTTPAVDLKLDLVSEKSRQAFLHHLREEYMDGMDADAWLSVKKERDAE